MRVVVRVEIASLLGSPQTEETVVSKGYKAVSYRIVSQKGIIQVMAAELTTDVVVVGSNGSHTTKGEIRCSSGRTTF